MNGKKVHWNGINIMLKLIIQQRPISQNNFNKHLIFILNGLNLNKKKIFIHIKTKKITILRSPHIFSKFKQTYNDIIKISVLTNKNNFFNLIQTYQYIKQNFSNFLKLKKNTLF